MSANSNVGVVTSALLGVINLTKALVEEVIETFMDIICLCHDHCVTFNDRVTNGSNCVDLGSEGMAYISSPTRFPNV